MFAGEKKQKDSIVLRVVNLRLNRTELHPIELPICLDWAKTTEMKNQNTTEAAIAVAQHKLVLHINLKQMDLAATTAFVFCRIKLNHSTIEILIDLFHNQEDHCSTKARILATCSLKINGNVKWKSPRYLTLELLP